MRLPARAAVVCALCAVALVLVSTGALAHVGIEVRNPRPGAESRFTVRVPNESATAATTLVEIQLPDGFAVLRVDPPAGWTMGVDEGVLVIEGGRIPPGESQEFAFRGRNPRDRGEFTFPAIQTYDDGEVVRWVGEPGSDKPAPVVAIAGRPVAQPQEEHTAAATPATPDPVETPTAATGGAVVSTPTPAAATEAAVPAAAEGSGTGVIWALGVIVLLATGLLGLVRARRAGRGQTG